MFQNILLLSCNGDDLGGLLLDDETINKWEENVKNYNESKNVKRVLQIIKKMNELTPLSDKEKQFCFDFKDDFASIVEYSSKLLFYYPYLGSEAFPENIESDEKKQQVVLKARFDKDMYEDWDTTIGRVDYLKTLEYYFYHQLRIKKYDHVINEQDFNDIYSILLENDVNVDDIPSEKETILNVYKNVCEKIKIGEIEAKKLRLEDKKEIAKKIEEDNRRFQEKLRKQKEQEEKERKAKLLKEKKRREAEEKKRREEEEKRRRELEEKKRRDTEEEQKKVLSCYSKQLYEVIREYRDCLGYDIAQKKKALAMDDEYLDLLDYIHNRLGITSEEARSYLDRKNGDFIEHRMKSYFTPEKDYKLGELHYQFKRDTLTYNKLCEKSDNENKTILKRKYSEYYKLTLYLISKKLGIDIESAKLLFDVNGQYHGKADVFDVKYDNDIKSYREKYINALKEYEKYINSDWLGKESMVPNIINWALDDVRVKVLTAKKNVGYDDLCKILIVVCKDLHADINALEKLVNMKIVNK